MLKTPKWDCDDYFVGFEYPPIGLDDDSWIFSLVVAFYSNNLGREMNTGITEGFLSDTGEDLPMGIGHEKIV